MAKTKSKKRTNTKPFNFYGARKTSNPKYFSVTLVRGRDDKREWLNVPVNKKNIKTIRGENYIFLKLSLLEDNRDDDDDDDDDEVDYDEVRELQSVTRSKAKAKAKKTDSDDDDDDDDEDLPF